MIKSNTKKFLAIKKLKAKSKEAEKDSSITEIRRQPLGKGAESKRLYPSHPSETSSLDDLFINPEDCVPSAWVVTEPCLKQFLAEKLDEKIYQITQSKYDNFTKQAILFSLRDVKKKLLEVKP